MKSAAVLGVLIIITSNLFIVLIFDTLAKANITCVGAVQDNTFECNLKQFNIDLIFGLLMISFFLMLDAVSFYIVVHSATF